MAQGPSKSPSIWFMNRFRGICSNLVLR